MSWIIIGTICFIFISLLIANIVIYIHNNNNSDVSSSCKTDSDCPPNKICIFSRDYNENLCKDVDSKECSVENGLLTECSLSDPKSCNNCINEPRFKCVKVSDSSPYIYQGWE